MGDVTGIAVGDSQLPGDGSAWAHDAAVTDGLESGLKGGGRGVEKSGRDPDELDGGQVENEVGYADLRCSRNAELLRFACIGSLSRRLW